jgi:hypothetical protein
MRLVHQGARDQAWPIAICVDSEPGPNEQAPVLMSHIDQPRCVALGEVWIVAA